MSLPGPPQLHLSIPTSVTSFKRNFEQFGLDLDDTSSPIVDSPHSDVDSQGRNKRARSEASFASVASATSSSSASGSSVTMASIRSPADSDVAAGPEFEASMDGERGLPSPASDARSVQADTDAVPSARASLPALHSETTTTTTATAREMANIITGPPRLGTPQIEEIVMEPMELDTDTPVLVPHTHSNTTLNHLLNQFIPPTADSSHIPSTSHQREREEQQDAFTRSLAQFAAFDTNIAALRRPLSFTLSHPSLSASNYNNTSPTRSSPPRIPTPQINTPSTPPPTLTLPPLVSSRLTLDLGIIAGSDHDRGLDQGPSADGDSNSNSDLDDLVLESDMDDWEVVEGERVQMNGNGNAEARERMGMGNEGAGHLTEGTASQSAMVMGNEVRGGGDSSLASTSGSNSNISGNTGSSSTTTTPTPTSTSAAVPSLYGYPPFVWEEEPFGAIAGGTSNTAQQRLTSSTSTSSSSSHTLNSARQTANSRLGSASGAESGGGGIPMTASLYVPTIRRSMDDRRGRVESSPDAGVRRSRRREGDLDLEFLERERRREMERTQRGTEGGREEPERSIPGEGAFALHLNTAFRMNEPSHFAGLLEGRLNLDQLLRGGEREREPERGRERERDGVGPPRIPPLPSLMSSGRDLSPLFASSPTSASPTVERDDALSTSATYASSTASTSRIATHQRSESLDSLGLGVEVPFSGPSNSSGSGSNANSGQERGREALARLVTASIDSHNATNSSIMTHNPVPRRPMSTLHNPARRPTPLGPRSASRNGSSGSGSGSSSANVSSTNINASASGPTRLPEVRLDTASDNLNRWRWFVDERSGSSGSSGEERSSASAGDYFSLSRQRTPWYTQSPVEDSSAGGTPAEPVHERARLSSDGAWSARRPSSLLASARTEEGWRPSWRPPSVTAGVRARPAHGTAIGPRPSSSHGPRPSSSAGLGATTASGVPRISMDLGLDSSNESLDLFSLDRSTQDQPTSASSSLSATTTTSATATGRQAGPSSALRFRNPTQSGPSHANIGHPPSSFNFSRFVSGHRRTSSENSSIPSMNVSRPRFSSNSLVSENASEMGTQLVRNHIRQQQQYEGGVRDELGESEGISLESPTRNPSYTLSGGRRPRAQIDRTRNPPRLATPPSSNWPIAPARHSAHAERPPSTWEMRVGPAEDNRSPWEREAGRMGDAHNNHGRGSLWHSSRPPSPVRHGQWRRASRDEDSSNNIALPTFPHSQHGTASHRNPPPARIGATYGILDSSSTFGRRERRDSDSSMEVDDEQLSPMRDYVPTRDYIPALPTPDLGDGFGHTSSLGFYSSLARPSQESTQLTRERQLEHLRFDAFPHRGPGRLPESNRPPNPVQEPPRRPPPSGGPLSNLDPHSYHPGPFRNTIRYMREMDRPRHTTANPPPSLPPLSLDDTAFGREIIGESPLLSRPPHNPPAHRPTRGVPQSLPRSEPSPAEDGGASAAARHRIFFEDLHMIPDAEDFALLYGDSRSSSPHRPHPSDNPRERLSGNFFRNVEPRFFGRPPSMDHAPLPVFGYANRLGARRLREVRRRMGGDYVRDEDFDTSYEALLLLSETIGDAKPKGIPESIIDGLETGLFKEWQTSDGDKRCPICLEDYAPDDMLMKLSECSHWMHRACLHQWLKAGTTCPVCRKSVAQPHSSRCPRARNVFGPRSRHGPSDRRPPDDGNHSHIHPPFFL